MEQSVRAAAQVMPTAARHPATLAACTVATRHEPGTSSAEPSAIRESPRRPAASTAPGMDQDTGWALAAASADLADLAGDSALHRRDALWSTALSTAIARRAGDLGAVQKHWNAALEVPAEYS